MTVRRRVNYGFALMLAGGLTLVTFIMRDTVTFNACLAYTTYKMEAVKISPQWHRQWDRTICECDKPKLMPKLTKCKAEVDIWNPF